MDRPRLDPLDQSTWGDPGTTPGVVLLANVADSLGIATVAHELGHACVRFEDLARRGAVDSEEWHAEMAADWYAYKWGFGRHIARHRPLRAWSHHGVAPGSSYAVETGQVTYHFRVTRNFVTRLMAKRPGRARPLVPRVPRPDTFPGPLQTP